MLNLLKLAVGAADPAELADRQRARAEQRPGRRPFFWTRNFPRRAEEVLDGGSIYWVMAGVMLCRQRIVAIEPDRREDSTPCTAVILEAPAIAVTPRVIRPFQGWRYLTPADAPADLGRLPQHSGDVLPPAMRRDLAALGLL